MDKKTTAAIPRQVNPKDVLWGPDPWPSDKYIEFLQSRGVPMPPMSKEEYYETAEEKRNLAIKAHRAEKAWLEINEAYITIERMLRSGNISESERMDLEHQKTDMEAIRVRAKIEYEEAADKHIEAVKRLLPMVEWIDTYRPTHSRSFFAKHIAANKNPPKHILFRNARYRLAGPDLGPEYYIEVSAADLDPEEVLSYHSGQWDPIYALGSRLNAYGETLASEEELEALVNTIERLSPSTEDQEERTQAGNLLYEAYRLLGKA